MTGRDIRLDRLFSGGNNAVVVAVDHGEFDGPIPGMVNLPEVVKSIDSSVDAILVAPGMLAHCGHAFNYKGAPMAMTRINWSSHFCFHWNYSQGLSVPAISPADAVAAGADILLACLTLRTGSESGDTANVEAFCKLVNEGKKLGVPVLGEFFPAVPKSLSPEDLHDLVYRGCRIIAELGADLIKTFHTENFQEVVEGCPIPILGLGAEKTNKQIQALELAERIVQDGGKGVVFGRNAIQVADPAAFQRALCAVVKDGMSANDAVVKFDLKD